MGTCCLETRRRMESASGRAWGERATRQRRDAGAGRRPSSRACASSTACATSARSRASSTVPSPACAGWPSSSSAPRRAAVRGRRGGLELKRYLGAHDDEVIARILGRRWTRCAQQIVELGRIQQPGRWTREEIAEFKRLYGTRTRRGPGAHLRPHASRRCKRLAQRYCLAKDKAFLRKLDGLGGDAHAALGAAGARALRGLYPARANLEIAQQLDRSVKSVVSKAHNLGLKKDAERLREMGRENVRCATPNRSEAPPRSSPAAGSTEPGTGPKEASNRPGRLRLPFDLYPVRYYLAPRGGLTAARAAASCRRPSRRT